MIKLLERDFCIVKYRSLPLQFYDKETNEDIFYYPKSCGIYWVKIQEIENQDDSNNPIKEFIGLINNLKIDNLIFLDQLNKPWVSKYTSKRTDYEELTNTLEYFKSLGIWTKFNGGVNVSAEEFRNFLPQFYIITETDGGFFCHYFIDEKQEILFYIHYSGEVKIITLNEKINAKFLKQIKKTKFVDSFRVNTDRI